MSRLGNFGGKLYRGEVSFDIVGRRKRWYYVSAVLLLVAVAGVLVRGLNLGIEFKGGADVVRVRRELLRRRARDLRE